MGTATRDWIRAWFERRNPGVEIDVEANYYSKGLVDSFGIIEMIEEVEEHFQVRFEDEEFAQESFRTIQGVAALVDRKLAGS